MSRRTNGWIVKLSMGIGLVFGLFTLGLGACGPGGGDGDGNGGSNASVCQPSCEKAGDCGQNPDNWKCTDGLCEADMCSEDVECQAKFSGFQDEGCATGDCGAASTCVKFGGTTYCAIENTGGSCQDPKTEKELDKEDGSGTIPVCVDEGASCNDGACSSGGSGGGGEGCQSDDQCPGGTTCNDSGECVCEEDADCPESFGLDKCLSDGTCTCSSDDSCAPLEQQDPTDRDYVCAQ